MALNRSIGARKDATRGTTALEVRRGLEGLFMGPGVLPESVSPLVQGTAGFTYQLNGPAWFVTKRATGDGVHMFANDGPITVATGVAPGAGLSRIDVLWVRHPSADENGDSTSVPEFGVTQGVAASIPSAPSLPAGALEVGRNTMTASATSTNSAGNTISQTAPRARMAGSRVRAETGAIQPLTFTAKSSETYAVSFPAGLFSSTPVMSIEIADGTAATSGWEVKPISVTSAGFTIFVYGPSSSWTARPIHWTATEYL